MILYYTGTGNSRYAARYIGDKINDEAFDLFDRLKNHDYTPINSKSPFVVCTPTYSWQIPHILRDWLLKTNLNGNKSIYFVMTCGGEIGNAEKYLKQLCEKINMNYMGCAEIVMPENYIALFEAPNKGEGERIINLAEIKLKSVAQQIAHNKRLPENKSNLMGKLYSSIVNDAFYPLFVKDKKFTVNDSCISCGICQSKCVMNNIRLVDGRPKWQGNCTHCMACINYCPKEAIEYGNHSRGLIRYTCKEYEKNRES